MTFREQCAHDAYNSALRAMEARGVDRDVSTEEMANDLADVAWAYADAMEARRLKRVPPPRPEPINDPDNIGADAPPRLTADQIAAVAQARRDGRDAGLREAVDYVWRRRKDTSIHCQIERSTLESIRDGIASLISKTPAPAPDLAALQAERERCALECEKVGETREGLRSAMVAVSCAERIRALT